jgi:hypothetical protein
VNIEIIDLDGSTGKLPEDCQSAFSAKKMPATGAGILHPF